MIRKKILIFFGHNANGDFLSYNGMIRLLLSYFDIHLCDRDRSEYIYKMFMNFNR